MNKASCINITLCVFALIFYLSISCYGAMKVLGNKDMEDVAGPDGILYGVPDGPDIEIIMELYFQNKKNWSNVLSVLMSLQQTIFDNSSNNGSPDQYPPAGPGEYDIAALSFSGNLNSSYSYTTQIVSNLSIGSIPGLTMLYGGGGFPGSIFGPNLIRNLTTGLTPAGTSFGSIMTQAFTGQFLSVGFSQRVTGVRATITRIPNSNPRVIVSTRP